MGPRIIDNEKVKTLENVNIIYPESSDEGEEYIMLVNMIKSMLNHNASERPTAKYLI